MFATTARPKTGYAYQSAPPWAFAILVGALALGAVGIAIGQGYKTAAAGAIPADLQGVHAAQLVNEYKAPAGIIPADLRGVHAAQQVDQSQAAPAGVNPADLRGAHAAQQVDQSQAAPAGTIPADLRGVHAAQQVDKAAPAGAASFPSPVSPSRNGHYRDHAR